MSSISFEGNDCETYSLAEVNPNLKKRLEGIRAKIKDRADPEIVALFRGKMQVLQQCTASKGAMIAKIAALSNDSQALQLSIQNIRKAQLPATTQSRKIIGNTSVQITQNITGIEETRAKLLQLFSGKKETTDVEMQQQKLALGALEKEVAAKVNELQKLKKLGKDYEYLEALLRELDGDEIFKLDPKFADLICIRERVNSFVHDIGRALIRFAINGKEVFNKSELQGASPQKIIDRVVAELGKYNLNIADFYTVLEFFHQGGMTQGYAFHTEKVMGEGMIPSGLGPRAIIELKIENKKLHSLTSTIVYAIKDPGQADEDQGSLGIVESQGKKQCTSVYDFVKGTVNLSVATIPFNKGEVAKINAESFLQAPSKE